MRVNCEKCGAAYAVDEKRIPDKGARAQCPKCKAVQVVRRPSEAAAPIPPTPSPVAPAPSRAAAQSTAPIDPLASIFGTGPVAPPAAADPFGGFAPAPGAAAGKPPGGGPASPSARPVAGDPFGGAAARSPAGMPAPDPFGSFGSGPDVAGAGADPFGGFASPPSPGGAAADPFGGFGSAPSPGGAAADPFGGFASPPSPGGAAADPFGGFGSAPSPGAPASDPFGGLGASSPGASADPFGAASGFAAAPAGGLPVDPFGAAPAPSAAPAAAEADPFGGSFAPPPAADPFGSPTPVVPSAQGPVIPCRECGTPLPDPLDAALGICENCRSKAQSEARSGPGPAPAAAASSGKVPVVVFGGAAAKASAPKPSPEADFLSSPAADLDALDAPAPAEAAGSLESPRVSPQALAAAAAKRPAPAKPAAAPLPAPKVVERKSSSGASVALLLVFALAAGGGGYVWFARPTWIFGAKVPAKSKYLPEIEKRLLTWRMALPGLSGTSDEHFKKGVELFRDDRTTSYIEAQEEFKAAVVLEPNNLDAVARYVEAFAVGQGERADPDRLAEARELLGAILTAKPKMALAHRAKANLLLATGQEELARAEAEEAFVLSTPEEQPEALLAWGRTYLKKSAPIAQEKFEQALQKEASLKRAIYYRGLSAEYAGNYSKAIEAYRERLKLDDDQRDALRALARVQARVGDLTAAREALDTYAKKYPDVGEPRVMRAQFAYVIERDLRDADRLLKALQGSLDKYDDTDRLQYHTLSAAVARERGDLKGAAEHVDAALKIDADWGPAHFQAMLGALAEGDAAKARQHLNACEQKLANPARFQEYVGRIEVAASQLDGAIAAFRKAGEEAATRVAPKLAAAALLTRRGDENGAWALLRKMLELDPSSLSRKRRPLSDYFEPEVNVIEVAAGAFQADSNRSEEQAWLNDIYNAIVEYHLGELDKPARVLDRSLSLDPTSLPALIYRAQIELDRKRYDKALAFARRASQADGQNPVANLLSGLAFEGLRKNENARSAYLKALDQNPRLAEANVRLAELALRGGNKDEARDRLKAVLSDDPENFEARVALFKLGY